MKKILIIEDDQAIITGLEEALAEEHFEVHSANDGETGYQKAKKNKYDLILLDLILPLKNGFDVCKDLEKDGIKTPIIMLTCKSDEIDKVVGLEIGADDYVTKPFSIRELIARIKAVIRRRSGSITELVEISFGDIYINFKKQEAVKKAQDLELSNMEFKLLKYFAEREEEVIERNKLLDEVWGYDSYPTTRTVDNFILSLRKKIEDDPSHPKHLLTVFGAGYKFVK